jgi:hypothetical protein
MKDLTKEDINLLLYTLEVYIFESGDQSEEVLSLKDKLLSYI